MVDWQKVLGHWMDNIMKSKALFSEHVVAAWPRPTSELATRMVTKRECIFEWNNWRISKIFEVEMIQVFLELSV